MSIATLKKKTQTQYNHMSVGQRGFALNGTRRLQGFVGQTSLSRSIPVTNMRGMDAQGYGGCCGKYPGHKITCGMGTYEGNSLNDPRVIKKSVINTQGMLATHYGHSPLLRVVKGVPGPHLDKVRNQALVCDSSTVVANHAVSYTQIPALFTMGFTRLSQCPRLLVSKDFAVVDQSQYLLSLDQACTA